MPFATKPDPQKLAARLRRLANEIDPPVAKPKPKPAAKKKPAKAKPKAK